ncbi:hypothetical protein GF068_34600 [Polyangium spumosum]|uniref:RCC1-like domain-containing protein n=2 Tax=Polyangium spumosum TaxID=889282 RepID=A0A6N7PYQ3_9BACT|nr:hypothetical protein [Polyangium spumosum]
MAKGAGGGGASSSGEGGSTTPPAEEATLTLVSPPPGMAFQRRNVDVDVAFTVSGGGATVRLQRGEEIVDERIIDASVTAGTARMRLPLSRGVSPFVVTIVSPSGTAAAEAHLVGGRLVAASLDTMYAVRDGAIVQWGGGAPIPTVRDAPAGIVSVAEGGGSLFALDTEGHVFVATAGQPAFEAVAGLEDIVALAPGGGHGLFLRADGRVFAAGQNGRGQLGVGDTESHAGIVEVVTSAEIVAIAASDDASFAVDVNGLVHAWGSNDEGQLGIGDEDISPHPAPLIVPNLENVVDVAAGRDHVLALTATGGVYAWGLGSSGQIGDGSAGILASRPQPVPIVLPDGAVALDARGNTSYAALASGELLGWGQNSLAQLGVGDTQQRTKPAPCLVGGVRAAAAGLTGAIALDDVGGLQVWGSNTSGQLALPLPPEGPERSSAPVGVPWP